MIQAILPYPRPASGLESAAEARTPPGPREVVAGCRGVDPGLEAGFDEVREAAAL